MKIRNVLPLLLASVTFTASASVLMLDFGPTSTDTSTNSPGHASGAVANTLTTWNTLGTADSSSLSFADGSAATGMSVNVGASLDAATTLALGTQPSHNNNLGSHVNTGVYDATSVGKDGIFFSATPAAGGAYNNAVGFQLSGLAAGTYDLYITARNTNYITNDTSYQQLLYAGSAASSGDFIYTSLSQTATLTHFMTGNVHSNLSTWSEGGNYGKLTVTLGAGDFLNFAVVGGASNESRGFLNSVQVVAIPEPGTLALISIALGSLLLFRRRRW